MSVSARLLLWDEFALMGMKMLSAIFLSVLVSSRAEAAIEGQFGSAQALPAVGLTKDAEVNSSQKAVTTLRPWRRLASKGEWSNAS